VAELQSIVSDRSDRDATQVIDRMTDRLEHFSHLPITAFSYRDS